VNWELSEDKEGHKIEKLNNFPCLTVRKLSFNSRRNSVKKEIKRDYGNEYSLSIYDYCMGVKESSFIWKSNFEDFVNEGNGEGSFINDVQCLGGGGSKAVWHFHIK